MTQNLRFSETEKGYFRHWFEGGILNYMAILPALLSRNLTGWSSGRIAPSCPMDWAARQNWKNCLKILGKLRKVIKLGKTLLIKLVSYYLSGSSRRVLGQFSENLKINSKPWKNDLTIFVKNNFLENCPQILSECSEYFRFCHLINHLLTGLLVPYREILSPRFLHTDLASSVRTSKLRA